MTLGLRLLLLGSLATAAILKLHSGAMDLLTLSAVIAEFSLSLVLLRRPRSTVVYAAAAIYGSGLVLYQLLLPRTDGGCGCVGTAPDWVAPTLAASIGLSASFLLAHQITESNHP